MSSSVAFRVSTPTQSPALFAPSSISTSTTTTAFDGVGMRDQRFASSHDLTLLATDSKEQKQIPVESHLPPRCKIICTIGPSSKSPEKLKQLMLAGMNVARLNFSHGDHKYHLETITNIREVTNETRRICAILLDTKGPEIRTGRMIDDKEVLLTKGSEFVLTTDESVLGDKDHVAVFYSNLPKVLKIGDHVLIDDGLIDLTVLEINEGTVKTRINNNGMLGSTKGVNLPGVIVDLPAVTQKDVADITFGIDQGIDFIAASFVRKRDDVLTIRKILESRGTKGTGIKIISKIENQEGLDNFDSILQVSDGIMVARGDLGVEIPIEQVAIAQKMMIRKCNAAGKFVVTATQMLESMTKNPSPTRAEATDVANAVLDGTDCVMLSGETAKGAYPVEAVRMMADICREAEASTNYRATSQMLRDQIRGTVSVVEAIASAAVRASFDLGASLLIVLTETGATARLVSKYRPRAPILTITSSEQCARQALVSRGLFPLLVGSMVGSDSLINRVIGAAQRLGMCQVGDLVVVTSGSREGTAGTTNDLKVVQVSFPFSQTHH